MKQYYYILRNMSLFEVWHNNTQSGIVARRFKVRISYSIG